MDVKGFGLPGKLSNVKVILNGGQRVTFLRADGFFSLYPIFLTLKCVILLNLIQDTLHIKIPLAQPHSLSFLRCYRSVFLFCIF